MRNILITGGAGFIGSHFTHLIAQETHDNVLVVDKLSYASDLSRIQSIIDTSRIDFVPADINDYAWMEHLFKTYDITDVVHFAAETHVDNSISSPGEFIQSNICGTYHLLEIAHRCWTGKQSNRFLHISTDEVYGELGQDEHPNDECYPYAPRSPYAASKAASDHLVRAWHTTYGLPILISHCANNYGPWQFPEKLIPLSIHHAMQFEPLPIYGDGKQIRDWLHVSDHCQALLRILNHGRIGESYNISAENAWTNLELIHLLSDLIDSELKQSPGQTKQLITHVEDRPGHDLRYSLNSDKLKVETGWEADIDFEEGLKNTVNWYINNAHWLTNQSNRKN